MRLNFIFFLYFYFISIANTTVVKNYSNVSFLNSIKISVKASEREKASLLHRKMPSYDPSEKSTLSSFLARIKVSETIFRRVVSKLQDTNDSPSFTVLTAIVLENIEYIHANNKLFNMYGNLMRIADKTNQDNVYFRFSIFRHIIQNCTISQFNSLDILLKNIAEHMLEDSFSFEKSYKLSVKRLANIDISTADPFEKYTIYEVLDNII